MTVRANTFASASAVGNREDLSDKIHNITPTECVFTEAIGDTKANATLHEWQIDALAAADANNAQVEGDSFDPDAITPTTRVGNRTQIFRKVAEVSGTQDAVNKAGRKKELAYQMAKRAKEIKRDMEAAYLSNNIQAEPSPTGTVGRKLAGIETWLTSNVSRGTGGSNGGLGTTAATDGTQRALNEDLVLDVCQSIYENSGEAPSHMFARPAMRRKFSTITGLGGATGQTRFALAKDAEINSAVDIYTSDFGTLKVMTSLHMRDRNLLIVNPGMIKKAYLRKTSVHDTGKDSDSTRKAIICEGTLEVCNEAGHGIVADLDATL